jgi:hypothetical protein
MTELKVRLTFLEDILGTMPNNEEVYRDYVASNAPDAATIEEEVAAVGVDGVIDKGITVFPRLEDGRPFLYDYQIKGFFKDACGMLSRVKTSESSKLKAYKKIVDGLVFVTPRKIPFNGFIASEDIGVCQRPLRAQTAQGERIALAISEQIHANTSIDLTITLLDEAHKKAVLEWLDYGVLRGIGQWRNSGKGRFNWTELQ